MRDGLALTLSSPRGLTSSMSTPIKLPEDEGPQQRAKPEGPREIVRRSLITGVAIALPLLVTLVVVGFVLNFVSNTLNPAVTLTELLGLGGVPRVLVEVITILLFVGAIFVVGYVSEYRSEGEKLNQRFDEFMGSLPGVGSVYTSFNEMSELLLDSDTESFREVMLVEYPTEGSYVVAFKTAETPDVIARHTGHEDMVTLFMPMAPNPVMGGFVIHVSRDRVIDVDLTVEQGIRSIVTSGVAMGEEDPALRGLTRTEMRELGESERVGQQIAPTDGTGPNPDRPSARREQYEAAVTPEHSETPEKIIDRHRTDDYEETEATPAELAGRERELERTDGTVETRDDGSDRAGDADEGDSGDSNVTPIVGEDYEESEGAERVESEGAENESAGNESDEGTQTE